MMKKHGLKEGKNSDNSQVQNVEEKKTYDTTLEIE